MTMIIIVIIVVLAFFFFLTPPFLRFTTNRRLNARRCYPGYLLFRTRSRVTRQLHSFTPTLLTACSRYRSWGNYSLIVAFALQHESLIRISACVCVCVQLILMNILTRYCVANNTVTGLEIITTRQEVASIAICVHVVAGIPTHQ